VARFHAGALDRDRRGVAALDRDHNEEAPFTLRLDPVERPVEEPRALMDDAFARRFHPDVQG
jgi:hypothetical protein